MIWKMPLPMLKAFTVAVSLVLTACAPTERLIEPIKVPFDEFFIGLAGLQMSPPARTTRSLIKLDPEALPKGAKAQYPSSDGDPFFVVLPVAVAEQVTGHCQRNPNWFAKTMMQRHLGCKSSPLSQSSCAVELEDFASDEMTFLIEMVMD
jgi:hypothetical protein